MNLNLATSRNVLLFLAASLTVLGSAIFIFEVLTDPSDMMRTISSLAFHTSAAGGLLTARFIIKHNYIRTLMRLHGWKGGGYAVWVKVYVDGRIVPEQNSPIVSCKDELPSVRWEPYRGKETTHVIVRDQVYNI